MSNSKTIKDIDTVTRTAVMFKSTSETKTIKCGDFINIVFDNVTGNIISINDELEVCLKWINFKHIVQMTITNFGGILVIKPPETKDDEYPGALSFLILKKKNLETRLEIEILITLNIDNTYIKKGDLVDIVLEDNNNFWTILKDKKGFRIVYYYKTLDILPYSVNELNDGQNKTIPNYLNTSIVLETKLKYKIFLGNYTIPIYAIILENPHVKNEYHFYNGVILVKNRDINVEKNVVLDINKPVLITDRNEVEINNISIHIMLHT